MDAAEDALYGLDKTGDEWPAVVGRPEAATAQDPGRRKQRWRPNAQAKGEEEPKPKAQRNFTDPDSRIMLSSDKAFIQAYNCHRGGGCRFAGDPLGAGEPDGCRPGTTAASGARQVTLDPGGGPSRW